MSGAFALLAKSTTKTKKTTSMVFCRRHSIVHIAALVLMRTACLEGSSAHGVSIFDGDPALESKILIWLENQV